MGLKDELTPEIFIQLYVREHMTLAKIGKRYNRSRQRIHQIKRDVEKKYGKLKRQIPVDPLTLKTYLDKGLTYTEIARRTHSSASTVSRLVKKYQKDYEDGISRIYIKKKKVADILSKHELFRLYVQEKKTEDEIAEMFDVSASSVNQLRHGYNIPTNYSKSLRKLEESLPKNKLKELTTKYTLKEIANIYDCSVVSIITLKKEYNLNK